MNAYSQQYTEIRKDLEEYIKSNRNEFPILSTHRDDISNQVLDTLSALGVFLTLKYNKLREESNLSTANLETSIYAKAKDLSYSIHRKSAPILRFTFSKNTSLHTGETVGTITGLDYSLNLVYMGVSKLFMVGDTVDIIVGLYNEIVQPMSRVDRHKPITLVIEPSDTKFDIDNIHYILYKNNKTIEVSKILEEYVVREVASDLSTIKKGIELWVSEQTRDKSYGVPLTKDDTIKFSYIETTGYLSNLFEIVRDKQIQLNRNELTYPEVMFLGHNGEDLGKVKKLAPLLYQTAKRAVSESDFSVICNTFPLFVDTLAKKSPKECCVVDLYYVRVGSDNISLEISDFEVDMFDRFFEPYSLGVDIRLIKANVVAFAPYLQVFYKANVRPTSDFKSSFEADMISRIKEVITKYNLKLSMEFTVGQLIAEICQNDLIDDVVIMDSNNNKLHLDYTISANDIEYIYTLPTIELIAR